MSASTVLHSSATSLKLVFFSLRIIAMDNILIYNQFLCPKVALFYNNCSHIFIELIYTKYNG